LTCAHRLPERERERESRERGLPSFLPLWKGLLYHPTALVESECATRPVSRAPATVCPSNEALRGSRRCGRLSGTLPEDRFPTHWGGSAMVRACEGRQPR
ncbi:hypothetical protein M758_9G014400, partial [Ceratodon purpureus]